MYVRRPRPASEYVRLEETQLSSQQTEDAARRCERLHPIVRVCRVINGVESTPLKRDARLLFQNAGT